MEPRGNFLRLETQPAVRTVPLPLLMSRLWMLAAPAADLAARFGIDIRTRAFWEDSLKVAAKRVERFCELVG